MKIDIENSPRDDGAIDLADANRDVSSKERLVPHEGNLLTEPGGLVVAICGDDQFGQDNAIRLAAAWNAFDGIATIKFAGKSVGEYVCEEAYLQGMTPAPAGLHMGMNGLACQMMAEAFAGQFEGSGAINFLEVGMEHDKLGPFTVTIQRANGKTPGALRAEALDELAAAQAQNAVLLAAARAMRAAWADSGCWPDTAKEMRALEAADDGLRAAIDGTAHLTPYKPLTEEEIEVIYANDLIDGWCGHDLSSDALQAMFKRLADMRATAAGAA